MELKRDVKFWKVEKQLLDVITVSKKYKNKKKITCTVIKYIKFLGGTAIPAWSIVVLIGISMLLAGGGLYALLQKFVVDNADTGESHASYQPALQTEANLDIKTSV